MFVNHEQRWMMPPRVTPPLSHPFVQILTRIRSTQVGRVILRSLWRDWTIITEKRNASADGVEAEKPPAQLHSWNFYDAAPKGVAIRDVEGRVLGEGTGLGSAAVMYFDLHECRHHPVAEDGVMVHELGHALHYHWAFTHRMKGRALPLPRRYFFPNSEEFFAQVIMNMYLVELGRPPIVGYRSWAYGREAKPHHAHHVPMGRSELLRTANERKLREFEQSFLGDIIRGAPNARIVFADLAKLPVPYNPFRDIADPTGRVYLPGHR